MTNPATDTILDLLASQGEGDTPDLEELADEAIRRLGWPSVRDAIFEALEANNSALWHPAAALLWGAVLDKRDMNANRAIALVYFRLDAPDQDQNLAWSIASKLKGAGYLSEYNPRTDPDIEPELRRLALIATHANQ